MPDETNGTAAGSEPTAVDLRDYVHFLEAEPAVRRVFATDVVAMDLVGLEPQQVIAARTLASADAIYTVIGGQAWIVTDEAEVTLAPLQSLLVPAGTPHGVRNDAVDPLILQVVVSPPDELPVAAGQTAKAAPRRRAKPGVLQRVRRVLGG